MTQLCLEQVEYHYPKSKKKILDGLDARFPGGKVISIVGQSGAGKSTLLYLISGLDRPKQGQLLLDGVPVTDLEDYRRNTVATISQSYLLFPTRTALENVMYPMQLRGLARPQAQAKAQACLESVGIGRELHGRLPGKLSGGEQQRVAIARCLAAQARIIAADEPTGNLDEENARQVMALLTSLAHDQGKTVILVTHDMTLARQADVRYRLEYGRLREE